jgi:hypothetical protein
MVSNNGVTWQAYWNGVPYMFRTILEITDDEELLAQGRLPLNTMMRNYMNIVEMRIKLDQKARISESSGFFFVLSKDGLVRVINEDDPELFKAWNAGWKTEWDSARSVEKGLAWAHENKGLLPWDKFNPKRMSAPMVLYRSVSIPELSDIVKTGKIMGKGNSFNEFDHRSWVFFGDEITTELVHQGEDTERKAQISLDNHPIHAKFAELQDRLKEKREQIADYIRDDWKEYSRKSERAGRNPEPVDEKVLADYVADRGSLGGVAHLMTDSTYKLTQEYRKLRAKIDPLRDKYREHYRKQHAKIRDKQQSMAITSAVLVTRPIDGGLVYTKGEGSESGFNAPEYGFPRGQVGLDDIEKVLYVKDGNVVAESLPQDIAKTLRGQKKVQQTPVTESYGDVWGFWITDEGKVIQTDDHHEYASGIFGNDEFEDDEEDFDAFTSAIRSALASGWIRVLCPNRVFAASWGDNPSPRARRALQRLIMTSDDFTEYRLNGEDYDLKREAARAAVAQS